MSRHGEKIRKRADGRWEGRFKIGNLENGNTRYASVYGHSYAEVKEKLEAKVYEFRANQTAITPLMKEVALEWLDINRQKNKGATEAKYDFLVRKHVIPTLGHIRIGDLTTTQLNKFCETKLSGDCKSAPLSPTYVRSIMLVISSIINYAVTERKCVPLNTPIYKPPAEKSEIRILKKNEQTLLEEYLRKDTDQTKLGILISLYTGLRIGEICALKWEDIDFLNGTINVRATVSRVNSESDSSKTELIIDKPKTRASIRTIPIPNAIIQTIRKVGDEYNTEYVISSKSGFLSPRTYEYRFHRILDHCSLDSINYHALRHTFATRCVEVGVDIKTLSEILGHASVAITLNTYIHPSMELKRSQINKLSSMTL